MNTVRVRIAPSPTGIPHIGNTRTALFNYLFAKRNKGVFILRIEDTDQKRIVPGSKEAIIEILNWLGLHPDEQYVQSDRLSIYQQHVDILKQKGLCYENEGALRFSMQKEGNTAWVDEIGKKQIRFDNSTQEDFVIIKSDGFPTYNFANVIDDYLMGITHVIRGEEFISSTPKHIQLYQAFGWKLPIFAHLPVILGPDRQKLSKRHGAKSVLDYRDEGYLKEALLNFMMLLGWNPGDDREIMSMDEMLSLFDLKDVNTANPIFDSKKLDWMNGVYIRKSQISNLKSQILSLDPRVKSLDSTMLDKLLPLAQTRIKTLKDFWMLIAPLLEDHVAELNQEEKEIAKLLQKYFSHIEEWSSDRILVAIKDIMHQTDTRMSTIYKITTGKESGLPLSQTLAIIGREKVIERIRRAL